MEPALLHISFISVKTVLKNTCGNCSFSSVMVLSLTRSHLTSPEIRTRKGWAFLFQNVLVHTLFTMDTGRRKNVKWALFFLLNERIDDCWSTSDWPSCNSTIKVNINIGIETLYCTPWGVCVCVCEVYLIDFSPWGFLEPERDQTTQWNSTDWKSQLTGGRPELAMYKHCRGVQPGNTKNKYSGWPEWHLNSGLWDFKSQAQTTLPPNLGTYS